MGLWQMWIIHSRSGCSGQKLARIILQSLEDKMFYYVSFYNRYNNNFSVSQISKTNLETYILLVLILAVTTFVFANSIEANLLIANIAYGQNKSASTSLSTTISHKTSPSKLHAIRITSPVRGQDVPVGKNLLVSGISTTGNATASSKCHISIIVNGIKPYQNASGIGPKGQNDYSKWTFLLIPKYTTIKQGLIPKYTAIKQGANKITSKFSCGNNANLVSYYGLNVTGVVSAGGSTSRSQPPAATTNNTPGIITPH